MYIPIPLSSKTLASAFSLVEMTFYCKEDRRLAHLNLIECLTRENSSKAYWVLPDTESEVIGLTGLYTCQNSQGPLSAAWLGWFCVHPGHRRRGIGSSLLEFTLDQARKKGFETLKIYTSTDRHEFPAHRLYDKFGFQKENHTGDREIVNYSKHLTGSI